ncbi:MAG: hypothetical protein ACI915_000620 [Gammaproteobacteria bacterium]
MDPILAERYFQTTVRPNAFGLGAPQMRGITRRVAGKILHCGDLPLALRQTMQLFNRLIFSIAFSFGALSLNASAEQVSLYDASQGNVPGQ